MTQKASASTLVLPAGSDPVVTHLEQGEYEIPIRAVTPTEGRTFAEVTYPDGWVREHHVTDATDLASKIVNNIRARFGAETVTIKSLPKALKAGASVGVEV